ncbi:MAG: glutathione S-transferase family protein [Proteobacteria bacterium]|jgi:glutathione S-transferase|nr:glutathione S-transferase family protein [Pseudomonadota bacterium]
MSLTLFGFGASRSFRCLWALEEAGLDFEYIPLTFGSDEAGGSQCDDYLVRNPQGKVPTLQHDDFVLTESAAILNYIDTLADGRFIPKGAKARAKYDELASFVVTELEQPLWTFGKHRFAIPEEYRVEAIFETANWEFKKALNTLQKLVALDSAPNHYALGDSFTFADILLAQTFHWAFRFEIEVPQECLDFRDEMFKRPACVKALARIE